MRTKTINRRSFLRSLCVASAASATAGSGVRFARAAGATSGRALVVVFLRGGCDGLNVVVPYSDAAYYEARPSIAIAPPAPGNPAAALDLDGYFGLHPALEPLLPLYHGGQVGFLPTVHLPTARLSHFETQALIEQAGGEHGNGWLNRYLADMSGATFGLGIGAVLPPALRGMAHVPAYVDPFDLRYAGDADVDAMIDHVIQDAWISPGPSASAAVETWRNAAAGLTADRERPFAPAAGGHAYPDDEFARGLAAASRLLRDDPNLSIVNIDLGGWDTHSNQGGVAGRQARQLDLLARSLAAFWEDLGDRRQDVAVLVQTEFGRTLKENASRGTDHGRATTWMLLSESLPGGLFLGPSGWPGLDEAQLVDRRYLAHTVDYRDVYAEILQGHMGHENVNAIIPERPGQSIGLI